MKAAMKIYDTDDAPVRHEMTIIKKEDSGCGNPKKNAASTGNNSDHPPADI